MRAIDATIGLAVIAFGGFVLFGVRNLTELGAIFPTTVGLALIGFGLILVVKSLMTRESGLRLEPVEGSAARRIGVVAALTVWGISLPFFGIAVAAAIGIAGLVLVSNFERWTIRRVATHVFGHTVIFASAYYIMAHLLSIPLPTGVLFD